MFDRFGHGQTKEGFDIDFFYIIEFITTMAVLKLAGKRTSRGIVIVCRAWLERLL